MLHTLEMGQQRSIQKLFKCEPFARIRKLLFFIDTEIEHVF